MAWIESHQELGAHPKTQKLARILGLSKPTVVGHLHYLWWWATDYAQDGNLSRFDSLDIAIGAEWEGDPDEFVSALIRSGFLCDDDGLSIHDWNDYAGKLIERRAKNAERMRAARASTDDERATHVQRTQRARATLPNTTKQNTTEQNQTLGDESPKTPQRARAKEPTGFDVFYANYPKKVGRDDAEKAWKKLSPSPELQAEINAAVSRQKMWESWQSGFIPNPATFLNGGRWKDEEPPPKSNGKTKPGLFSGFEEFDRMTNGAKRQDEADNVIEPEWSVR